MNLVRVLALNVLNTKFLIFSAHTKKEKKKKKKPSYIKCAKFQKRFSMNL